MELMRTNPSAVRLGAAAACVLTLTCVACGENTAQLIYAEHAANIDAGQTMSAIGSPVGYATVPTADAQSTTGGGVQVVDFATTCAELKAMLEDTNRRVVVVKSSIDCHLSAPVATPTCERPCDDATDDSSRKTYRVLYATDCSAIGGSATDPIIQKMRNETTINVASNKTLLGQGPGNTVTGATLYIKGQSNVIIQNLNLGDINPTLLEAGDAITLDDSDHIWVDHCTFSRISDGFVDAIHGSLSVTISWNKFEGANPDSCAGQHNYTNTIEGSSVTFYDNFYDHTLGYSPKLSQGSKAHLFDNY
jgi:pectate lyase